LPELDTYEAIVETAALARRFVHRLQLDLIVSLHAAAPDAQPIHSQMPQPDGGSPHASRRPDLPHLTSILLIEAHLAIAAQGGDAGFNHFEIS
jgi:hypothetical protein